MPAFKKACVLPPFKSGQVHGIHGDRKIFTEPLGCLACLYSWMGELQTASICLSHVMALAPQHGTHLGTCPVACLPSSCPNRESLFV